jgi:hypothetical protein
MALRVFSVVLLWLIAGCGPRSSSTVQGTFDVDAFLNAQVGLLSQRGVTLQKQAAVNGVGSDSTLVPSAARWTKELEIFRQLNQIGSRLYSDTYDRDNALDDPQSNLKIQRFSSATAPLRELRLYYQDDLSHLRRVVGEVVEDNPMYAAGRTLTLEIEEDGAQLMLSSYRVVGYQKLALRDTARYMITGTLRW